MTLRNHATLDAATLPPDTTLERSDTTAYTASASTPQTVRSTDPKSTGAWYVEWIAYGVLGTGSDIRVGVCLAAASSTAKLGEASTSVAYTAAGTIRSGGSTVHTGTAWTTGDVIGVLVDLDDRTATWFRNGAVVESATLPGSTGDAVTPACTLVAGAGDDTTTPALRVLYSAGQQTLDYPPGGSVLAGWWTPTPGIGLIRAADRAYRDSADLSAYWPSAISNAALSVTQGVSFWPWGRKTTRAQATLRLNNADGRYDNLLVQDARDAAVTMRTLADGDALSAAVPAASYIVDGVQAQGDAGISLTLRDASAGLEAPLQHRLMLPTVDEAMIGKPWPLVLGAVRSLPLACIDAEEQVYAMQDGAIAGVSSIRDRGAAFAPSLGDYVLQSDGPGTVTLASIAQGVVTADVSSLGGDSPEPPTDLLAGKGDMTTPADWTLPSGGGATYTMPQTPMPRLKCVLTGSGTNGMWSGVKIPGFSAVAGQTYMLRLTMQSLTDNIVSGTSNGAPSASLRIAYGSTSAPDRFAAFSPVRIYTPGVKDAYGAGYNPIFDSGTQPVTIIGTATRSGPLWLGFEASNYGGSYELAELVIWQLLDNELDDESLVPITFAEAMQVLLEQHLGWTRAQWSIDDALTIDDATGYAGVGIASTPDAPLTIAAAVRLLCDAYCVDTWQDASGVLRFARLVDPATASSEATITPADMLTEPSVSIDLAPDLTTQIAARRNWRPMADSEMVSDDVGLPYTIDGGVE